MLLLSNKGVHLLSQIPDNLGSLSVDESMGVEKAKTLESVNACESICDCVLASL